MILVKIGGSLITDKRQERSIRRDVLARLTREIYTAVQNHQRIVLGHGSGSFGHFEANRHGTMQGVDSPQQWMGFVHVSAAAASLNQIVVEALLEAGVPAVRVPPGATALAENGQLQTMDTHTLMRALDRGLLPVVYGDAVFDQIRGGTIVSTETIFTYLIQHLPVTIVLLLGEVDGVLDDDQRVIPHLTPANIQQYASALKGSHGVDVTGGMLTKVTDMLALAQQNPAIRIRIINGLVQDALLDALAGKNVGTLITA